MLLVDAENAFNAVNRKTFLHNINLICSLISTFAHNFYSKTLHLIIIGLVETSSSEDTMESGPPAKAVYGMVVIH